MGCKSTFLRFILGGAFWDTGKQINVFKNGNFIGKRFKNGNYK
jgi:hypothetical protein